MRGNPVNIRFLPSKVAEKNATKNIVDARKDGRTDGRTDVKQYTPLRWSGGIIISKYLGTRKLNGHGIATIGYHLWLRENNVSFNKKLHYLGTVNSFINKFNEP